MRIRDNLGNMRSIVVLFLLQCFAVNSATAQVASVNIGVDGLTCSQCSRSVEMSLRKLSFVKDVQMSLESTEGKITFIEGSAIDPDKIAKAVVNAGFSLRFLTVRYHFKEMKIANGFKTETGIGKICFVKTGIKVLNGLIDLQFIGKRFTTKQEYKKSEADILECCGKPETKTYYVTIQ